MNLFKWKTFAFWLLYAGLLLFLLCMLLPLPNWALTALGILSLCCMLAFPVVTWVTWRCPFCRKRLPRRELARDGLEACPFCREKLPARK